MVMILNNVSKVSAYGNSVFLWVLHFNTQKKHIPHYTTKTLYARCTTLPPTLIRQF